MTVIRGSNVLITGGAGGIGRLMALELARRGASVALWDIDERALEETKREVGRAGGREAWTYLCDISDRNQVYDTADRVKREVGALDILINNAGIVSGNDFLDLPDEKIEATFRVNALGPFWTAKAFLPSMIERDHGHLVTVASAGGLVGVARLTDYCASKHAAVGFDESLRVELKRVAPGVRTTIVCPYYIDTGMFDGVKTRFSALLPILKEHAVAARIIQAIEKNRARVMLPPLVMLVPVLRFLPVPVFDPVASLLGINASMDEFVGHGR